MFKEMNKTRRLLCCLLGVASMPCLAMEDTDSGIERQLGAVDQRLVDLAGREQLSALDRAQMAPIIDILKMMRVGGDEALGQQAQQSMASPLDAQLRAVVCSHASLTGESFSRILDLLGQGADPNVAGVAGNTTLHDAVRLGVNRDVIEALLCWGALTSKQNNELDTPAHLACARRKTDDRLFELLLDPSYGAILGQKNKGDLTAFELAKKMKMLTPHRRELFKRCEQGIALHQACYHNQVAVASALVDAGAPVYYADPLGQTALHVAVHRTNDISLCQKLLDVGVDIDHADKKGLTALHFAVLDEKPEMVKAVLAQAKKMDREGDAAFNLNQWINKCDTTPEKMTPLHRAAQFGSCDIAKQLLEVGADPMIPASDGSLPLHGAALRGYDELAKLLLAYDSELAHRMVNVASHDGVTPLMSVFLKQSEQALISDDKKNEEKNKKKTKLVCLLFKAGANPLVTANGFTVLHYALANGQRASMAEFLIASAAKKQAADVVANFVNTKEGTVGNTVLHNALTLQNGSWAGVLLAHGADANAANNGGVTPLHIVARYGDSAPEIVNLLLAHSANPNCALSRINNPSYEPKMARRFIGLRCTGK